MGGSQRDKGSASPNEKKFNPFTSIASAVHAKNHIVGKGEDKKNCH